MGFFSFDRGDPNPEGDMQFVSPGFAAETASNLISSDLAQDLVDPTVDVFFASDTPDAAQGTAHGIVIDHATGAFLREIRTTQGNMIAETDTFGNLNTQPINTDDPPPPRIVSVSGFRQEVSVFGEHDASGKIMQSVRVYDFDLRNAQVLPIIGRNKVVDPVAVTYRSEDDSYYFLDQDRDHGLPIVRLNRFTRGLTIEHIAQWPRSGHFDTYALTTGEDGNLVLSASTKGQHAIAVLSITGQQSVGLEHLSFGSGAIAVPAQSTFDGIDYGVLASNGGMTVQRDVADHVNEGSPSHHSGRYGWLGHDEHHEAGDLGQCF
jgi:hypothetical protein